jgi:hypothetical protein
VQEAAGHRESDSDSIYRMNMMDTKLDDPHLILFILSNHEVGEKWRQEPF